MRSGGLLVHEEVVLMTGTNFIIIMLFMNFIFWNCRGAGNNGFCEVMHDMRRLVRCNILAVAEPRVSGVKADKIIEKLNFENSLEWKRKGCQEVYGYCGISRELI